MIWILKNFVKDGDIVLDPMAGIGGTLCEGIRLFPNSLFIGVELEEKFVKWCNASIKKTERIAKEDWFMEIGKAVCLQGDSRELEKVLKEKVDKIVSSPPYSQIRMDGGGKDRAGMRPYTDEPPNTWQTQRDQRNIGNLKHGNIDKIITSPPFGGQVQHKTNYLGRQKRESGFEYSDNPQNIGNLPQGKINKIITSPPFGQAQSGGGIAKKGYDGPKHSPTDLVGKRSYMPENTGKNKDNISNLKYAPNKIITSPPYGESEVAQLPSDMGGKHRDLNLTASKINPRYAKNKNNIGNLKQQTYLEAMFLVYQQCFKILKSEGLMILILKDFIRKGKRIPLGEHTIKLCEMAGFKYIKTFYRKIEHLSFWRIIQIQKYGEAYRIDAEDILLFRK